MAMRADELAERIGAELRGDGSVTLAGCAALAEAGPSDLSFLANPRYLRQLDQTRAGAIVLGPGDAAQANGRTVLIADDPYFAFRSAVVALVGFRPQPGPGVSEQAAVAPGATVGPDCHISPFTVVAEHARIGARCVIYPGCYVGRDARIGDDCILYPNVTVYDGCVVGDRVTLHAGCSIGQDGFGYATHPDKAGTIVHHKIPPLGHTVIEDDVELGACCTVDRATVGATVVGAGTKCSNNVTIGHGCKVGRHNLLVAQVGLAGSTKTGDYVVMGGQAGAAGHLEIGDGAQFAAQSGIAGDVPGGGKYGGAPVQPLTQAKRQYLAMARLPEMLKTMRRLQQRLDQLEDRLARAEPSAAQHQSDAGHEPR